MPPSDHVHTDVLYEFFHHRNSRFTLKSHSFDQSRLDPSNKLLEIMNGFMLNFRF